VGIGRGAGEPGWHGRDPDRLAQPRAGARDDLRAARRDRFGLPIDSVSIVHGDTDKVQFGMGTYGSRSGPVGMSAIMKALDKVEEKAKKIAAHVLEASEDDIVIEGGEAKVAGTDKKMGWHEVGLAAYTAHNLPEGMEPGLKETSFFDPQNFSFPSGALICEVEVDPTPA
jgi:carbon-monoxide dehydrogenase large subunit